MTRPWELSREGRGAGDPQQGRQPGGGDRAFLGEESSDLELEGEQEGHIYSTTGLFGAAAPRTGGGSLWRPPGITLSPPAPQAPLPQSCPHRPGAPGSGLSGEPARRGPPSLKQPCRRVSFQIT